MASRRAAVQEAAKAQGKATPNKKIVRKPAAPERKEPEKKPATRSSSAGIKTLRVLLVIVGFVVALIAGLAVGYAMIGKQNISDVLYPETWAHIFQLVFAP
ncbi:DNA-directed RNA polymerase subunit beta [Paenibacillus sp. PsM32]|uniref:DNA-directed RNA polymerase subunit beta n=1 Tax=Paenibacillus kyungheensis TaxID=1452732 RepID=A0AAX3M0W8_9BACL|nr:MULTISPECIES: DNA-directed RNA polymerase subunit beta [Paenibacillus]MDN4620350.1 DNA-directed RNA polymerase subunit beta [Paenibacillus sp. PsM32]MDQ1235908.1 uncharacterized protein HemX [Paenibacillus sp. SORGH_AS_0306]MDR6112958.1 uncharacterized protein HemX [Paenibacillus sp. SORGH_AS_0338]WCT55396.1 DNA-directed RNA polymerase subunit beta [Paenibacillus kyungheensis]WDF51450.1 DNA-directed RNA polymerase subunit beta [Paenibacillus sp. KACC 21273]